MMSDVINKKMARDWFLRCVSCSEATFTILDRGAGLELDDLEQAAHPLAGGFLSQGHACGMVWGTGLAIGVRAGKRFDDPEAAASAALTVMVRAVDEFEKMAGSINCREIIGCSLARASGRLRYILSGKPNLCTRLVIKWTPFANELIDRELDAFEKTATSQAGKNCAVETMSRCAAGLGIDVDPGTVAAFAGGAGLRGNACGALAAGVFALGLKYYQGRNKPRDTLLGAALQELGAGDGLLKAPDRLREKFISRFGSELCLDVAGRKFASPGDHSDFISGGGCEELIEAVPRLVSEAVKA
jgi:hypothetical protein